MRRQRESVSIKEVGKEGSTQKKKRLFATAGLDWKNSFGRKQTAVSSVTLN